MPVALSQIGELDEDWWYDARAERTPKVPTPRSVVAHMRLVLAVDLSFPIILCAEGRLMDGMHRVARAVLDERDTVLAVRFPVTPAPDHVDVDLDDLPYDDVPLDGESGGETVRQRTMR